MMITQISEHGCFGGKVVFCQHASAVNNCDMRFAVYMPPQATEGPVPLVTYLAGLTCTEETFMIKGGAQRVAAELGIALLAPDTSPRGNDVPDDPAAAYDFGLGAGFYLDATRDPWAANYRMYSYLTRELPNIVQQHFSVDLQRQGIMGHSMGGHGALTLGLKHLDTYRSISAFAPICSPMNCPWGNKALGNYLGDDKTAWREYDACELVRGIDVSAGVPTILIDQGLADQFLAQELHPHLFEEACQATGYPLRLRRHAGYDHGYYFIATFMEDHLRHHAATLLAD
jgi:S-formylglutathione hydrolase